MVDAEQADTALKGIEARLSEGGVVDLTAIMADIERIQQNFDQRLRKLDVEI